MIRVLTFFLGFVGSSISCSTLLQSVDREVDWKVFFVRFNSAPANLVDCNFKGGFMEKGVKYSVSRGRGEVLSVEQYEFMSIFSERYALEKDFYNFFGDQPPYFPESAFLDFRGEEAVIAFSHLSQADTFLGKKLAAASGDFDCIDGVIYLRDINDRSGGEGVDHSKNAVTALRLSDQGDLLVYHAESPASPRSAGKGIVQIYYLFKNQNPIKGSSRG